MTTRLEQLLMNTLILHESLITKVMMIDHPGMQERISNNICAVYNYGYLNVNF